MFRLSRRFRLSCQLILTSKLEKVSCTDAWKVCEAEKALHFWLHILKILPDMWWVRWFQCWLVDCISLVGAGTVQQHYRVLCRSCTTEQVRQCVCMCLLHLWSRPTERLEAFRNLCKFQSRQIQVLPESRSTTLVQDLDLHSCDLSHLAAVPLSATGTSYFQSMTCLGRSAVSVLRPLPFEATCEGTQGSQKAFV